MQEDSSMKIGKRKYTKKNTFKMNFIFSEKGEELNKIIERAFENYCLTKTSEKI